MANPTSAGSPTNYLDIARDLIYVAYTSGFIGSNKFVVVPELAESVDEVCDEISAAMGDLCCESPDAVRFAMELHWAIYAGIGAAYHWNRAAESLEKTGILNALTAPRGFENLIAYVADIIGLKDGSKEHQRVDRFFSNTIVKYCMDMVSGAKGVQRYAADESRAAAFMFGIIFELNRLGIF